MSDIPNLTLNALWMFGLSVILSAIGIGWYMAGETHLSLGKVLEGWEYHFSINLGAILLCTGMVGLAGQRWERILWGLLGMGFVAEAIWDKIEQCRNRNRT